MEGREAMGGEGKSNGEGVSISWNKIFILYSDHYLKIALTSRLASWELG